MIIERLSSELFSLGFSRLLHALSSLLLACSWHSDNRKRSSLILTMEIFGDVSVFFESHYKVENPKGPHLSHRGSFNDGWMEMVVETRENAWKHLTSE